MCGGARARAGLRLDDAIQLMFLHKIKKLIVTEGEEKDSKLVGLVTLTDIARIEPVLLKTLRALFEVNKEAARAPVRSLSIHSRVVKCLRNRGE